MTRAPSARATVAVIVAAVLLPLSSLAGAPAAVAASTTTTVSTFGGTGVYEPSGLVESRQNPGMFFSHNEDRKNLLLIGPSGVAAQYSLPFSFPSPMTRSDAFDWEDIAVGPCPSGRCVFVADTGKVSGTFPAGFQRSTFAMYRVPEPRYGTTPNGARLTGLERFPFRYPDGSYDAEAMVVHPRTGTVYVLTKAAGTTRVYRFPQKLTRDAVVTLQFVAQITLPSSTSRVTGADVDAMGTKLLLRTYTSVLEYTASSGGAFETVFSAAPKVLTNVKERQGESIAYRADGAAYYTVDEQPTNGVWSIRRVVR